MIKSKNRNNGVGRKQIVLIMIVVVGFLVFSWISVSFMQLCIWPRMHECIWITYVVLVGIALVAVVVGYQTFRAITA